MSETQLFVVGIWCFCWFSLFIYPKLTHCPNKLSGNVVWISVAPIHYKNGQRTNSICTFHRLPNSTRFNSKTHTTNEWKGEEKNNICLCFDQLEFGGKWVLHAANSHAQCTWAHLYRFPNEMLFAPCHTLWCLWLRFYELNSYSLNLRFFAITENWLHLLRFRLTFIQPTFFLWIGLVVKLVRFQIFGDNADWVIVVEYVRRDDTASNGKARMLNSEPLNLDKHLICIETVAFDRIFVKPALLLVDKIGGNQKYIAYAVYLLTASYWVSSCYWSSGELLMGSDLQISFYNFIFIITLDRTQWETCVLWHLTSNRKGKTV